jgi:hypothetical protein
MHVSFLFALSIKVHAQGPAPPPFSRATATTFPTVAISDGNVLIGSFLAVSAGVQNRPET